MILTADSGSTKTTWKIETEKNGMMVEWGRYSTQGINPFHQSEDVMRNVIDMELMAADRFPAEDIVEVHFFGAGCTKEKSPVLQRILREMFPQSSVVEVDSDMLGAAKALFGNEPGIACILGTGANSCLYDGERIVSNVSPMGYILGDEGSGAVIGKTFLNALYKGEHREFIDVFENETGLCQADIIQRVYREAMPNRFLASLCPFIKKHISEMWIEELVVNCLRLFFEHNVKHYHRPELPCSFVGSIAYHFEEQLKKASGSFKIGKIMKEPLV